MNEQLQRQTRPTTASLRAVIFDFNGTISPIHFIDCFAKFQADLPMEATELVRLYASNGLLRRVMTGELSEEQFWIEVASISGSRIEVLRRIATEIRVTKQVDHDMLSIVERLRPKYRLALLTDNVQETFRYWVSKFALNDYFEVIVNSADIGSTKIDTAIYSKTLQLLRCEPHEALLVDDDKSNLEIAGRLGIRGILYQGSELLLQDLVEEGLLHALHPTRYWQRLAARDPR